ncbi:MAG: DciA family protein [Hyphomicrobium sp.]|uniref:DUF721 domain-containing protein n=1 Tax=Hyphomicrobium sp. TaxID=82 RepID=UPI0013225AD4|nr:DciA family protein [Hyphomicrobium sp.]KAB2942211.1 MAG: DUF721 domain-containing protein [Hyphomicrobium sp.]MBZ0208345.1 DciA family protein [Hyphomicrobium sp.]
MASNTATLRAPATPPTSMHPRGFVAARAVGTYVPKLTHKAFEKYGFAAAALITDWAVIVGNEVAGYTAPERLKWPRGVEIGGDVEEGAQGRPGATLIVRVEPARALDVQYRAQQLIERINAHFGYRAVAELRLLQAPLPERSRRAGEAERLDPPACAAPELAGIADERLRLALANLKTGLTRRGQVR